MALLALGGARASVKFAHGEDGLDFDGDAAGKRGHAYSGTSVPAAFAKHLNQQVRTAVDHGGVGRKVACSIHHPEHFHNSRDAIQRSQYGARLRQEIKPREPSVPVGLLRCNVASNLACRLAFVADGPLSRKKQKIALLDAADKIRHGLPRRGKRNSCGEKPLFSGSGGGQGETEAIGHEDALQSLIVETCYITASGAASSLRVFKNALDSDLSFDISKSHGRFARGSGAGLRGIVDRSDAKFETLIDFRLGIGESPVWDDRRRVLWFVDILAPAVMALDPATRLATAFPMPSHVGSVSLVNDGRLIVAMRSGVYLFEPGSNELTFLVHPEPDRTMNRLNDGKVGPDGCFWVGSMHDATPRARTGGLYRIDPSGECRRVLDGLRVSNGLAWSPEGATLYHADTRDGCVKAFDFDIASGALGHVRELIALTEEQGFPDGAAVDDSGCYWSAGVTSGNLNRISPQGVLLESLQLPVAAPTMPCFGGDDGRTVFVTSLASDRDGKGGTLLSFRSQVSGSPLPRFGAASAAKF